VTRTGAVTGVALALSLAWTASASAERLGAPEGKLGTQVRDLVAAQAAGGTGVRGQAATDRLDVDRSQRVLVDVYVHGDATDAAQRLADAGMDVTGSSDAGPVPVVEGWLPVASAEAVAGLGVTRAVQAVAASGTDAGAVTSAGDAVHHGPQARTLGFNGAGVKVGLMSDSIDRVAPGVAGSQASGDLPADVQVIADGPNGSEDEGRAMAEIVYDTAPGITDMAFATGGGGPVTKAGDIGLLRANGAQVIADDTFYLQEPFFQDGVVAQAVDTARAAGVTYLASAGNRARQSWEGTYADSGNQQFNDFGGGDTAQSVATVPNGGFIVIELQWDEPFGGATTDLDAFLLDMSLPDPLSKPLAASIDDNLQTGIPAETVVFVNNTGASKTVGLAIQRFAANPLRAPFMKWIGFGGSYNIEHGTASDAIDPDAASAQGSLAVAAVNAGQPALNSPEPFSSRGLKTRLFDVQGNRLAAPLVLQKPSLAGADGVNTTVSGFAPFFGTSAAAPSAAGVAALVKSAYPAISADDLAAVMTNPANAIDCVAPGDPDTDCGAGFILADRAVGQVLAPAAPILTGTNPASPAANGSPRILGSAPAGTTVSLFANATCSGAPVATGTAASFAAPGLAVAVPDNTTVTFSATAVNSVGRASACSPTSIAYANTSAAAASGSGAAATGGGGAGAGGSGAAGTGTGTTTSAAVSNAFSIGRLRALANGSIQVDLDSPGAGAYGASATFPQATRKTRKRRKPSRPAAFGSARADAAAAGPVTMTIRPSGNARSALRARRRLTVTVSVTFTPVAGTAGSRSATVSVRAPARRKSRHPH
jgi:subtilase family protein